MASDSVHVCKCGDGVLGLEGGAGGVYVTLSAAIFPGVQGSAILSGELLLTNYVLL